MGRDVEGGRQGTTGLRAGRAVARWRDDARNRSKAGRDPRQPLRGPIDDPSWRTADAAGRDPDGLVRVPADGSASTDSPRRRPSRPTGGEPRYPRGTVTTDEHLPTATAHAARPGPPGPAAAARPRPPGPRPPDPRAGSRRASIAATSSRSTSTAGSSAASATPIGSSNLRSCVKPFGVVALIEAGGIEAFDLEPRRARAHGELALGRGPPRPDAPGRCTAGPASARR